MGQKAVFHSENTLFPTKKANTPFSSIQRLKGAIGRIGVLSLYNTITFESSI